jgi:hypothetical protein
MTENNLQNLHFKLYKQDLPDEIDIDKIYQKMEILYKQWAIPAEIIDNFKDIKLQNDNLAVEFYVQLLRDFDPYFDFLSHKHERDMLFSGMVFFYGTILYNLNDANWAKNIPDILYYLLLYFLVDHYLDDENKKEKPEYQKYKIHKIREILTITNLESKNYKDDKMLFYIAQIYDRLVKNKPLIREGIIKLYDAEIKSVKIQKNANLSFEEYTLLLYEKGGLTTGIMSAFINHDINSTESIYFQQMGVLIQFFDDIIDYEVDQEKGHYNTISYCVKEKKEHILLIYMLHIIDNLDPYNNFLRIFSLHILAYIIVCNPIFKNYTILHKLLTPYNFFPVKGPLNTNLTSIIERYFIDKRFDRLNLQLLRERCFFPLS